MSPSASFRRRSGERGFSLLQILVVLGITGIVAGMAIFGIRSARATVRLNNSARTLAQYAEKARLDAIRRRTTTHVEFTGPDSFEVTMDFSGDGAGETRTFKLEDGVVLTDANGATVSSSADNLPYADFDWRGRTYECNALFPMKNARGEQLSVQIAGSGDITVNSSITGLPTVTYTNVNASSDVNPSATLAGTDSKLNLSPCGTVSATPTPTPTLTPTPTPETPDEDPPCSLSVNPTSVSSLQRNGGGEVTVTATANKAGTFTASPDKDNNLTVTTTASQTVTSPSGGSVAYKVKSKTNSKGTFSIKFEFSSCTSPVSVDVTVVK